MIMIMIKIFFLARTNEFETPLQHAIRRHLPVVVDVLSKKGANLNIKNKDGDCPLWQALDSGQEDVEQVLVRCNDIIN